MKGVREDFEYTLQTQRTSDNYRKIYITVAVFLGELS